MLLRLPFPDIIFALSALIVAFTVHELSHGLMAYALGDNTAKYDGRLTLNPVRHIDPIGFLILLFAGFGWAKPVMVDTRNFRYPKQDMALTAVAGPLSNFLLAFISVMLLVPLMMGPGGGISGGLATFLSYMMQLNLVLGIFNLIPLPPLDGSKLFGVLLPDSVYFSFIGFGSRYGMIILLILVFTGMLGNIISPLLSFGMNLLFGIARFVYM
ncbi:MAG: site-2 protease family protein [Defluviitaleaceae bacterium]|nr:site-2 protease family protein [Defluviitaleaceae bacterium]